MNNLAKSSGLSPETIRKIRDVFNRYPGIDWVKLYGSRAKGNFQHGSDIDLTIMGDGFDSSQLFRIETDLDDLLLPYTIDISLFRKIKNDDLVEHIQRVGIDFFRRPESKQK